MAAEPATLRPTLAVFASDQGPGDPERCRSVGEQDHHLGGVLAPVGREMVVGLDEPGFRGRRGLVVSHGLERAALVHGGVVVVDLARRFAVRSIAVVIAGRGRADS